ncbi:MAG TPA: hypothetical protein VGF52_00610, partial [Tepidisphaeraceae bacterium]
MPDEPLRFSNEIKLRRQMDRRGWTDQQIREALATQPLPGTGKRGPAMRYIHPTTGRTLLVDASSGEIFHVGGERFRYDNG